MNAANASPESENESLINPLHFSIEIKRNERTHAQLYLEFRPESLDGIVLLTGERDDLTGDFMAVLIHQGFIEFW